MNTPSIQAPESFKSPKTGMNDLTVNGEKVQMPDRVLAARATRVVGSLDHPVLPMPPVSMSLFFTSTRIELSTAENYDTCYGFFVMLRYCSECVVSIS